MSIPEKIEKKITGLSEIPALVKRLKSEGIRVVFTNGVFDIVHRGHVTLLSLAADQGDFLIVGLNADSSVKTLNKGPERPINGEQDRAVVLASMQFVDAVVIFPTPTPFDLISMIQPDVLVKGGDYNPDQTDKTAKDYIVGSDIQRKNGKTTISIPLVEGYSTTSIIKRSKNG